MPIARRVLRRTLCFSGGAFLSHQLIIAIRHNLPPLICTFGSGAILRAFSSNAVASKKREESRRYRICYLRLYLSNLKVEHNPAK